MDNHRLPIALTVCITAMSVLAYVVLEWLFFVTKPSLLSYLPGPERIAVLFVAPLPFVAWSAIAALAVSWPLAWLWSRFVSVPQARFVLAFLPASIMSATELLLIDNFTYTLFNFGISSLSGAGRIVHTVVLICLVLYNTRLVAGMLSTAKPNSAPARAIYAASAAVLLVSGAFAAAFYDHGAGTVAGDHTETNAARRNVIVFSSDGIDAASMSAYGYHRDTTPFITTLLDESLVFENHFTNSAKTTGSVASLLSGKLPTTTRVVFRPDTFTGIDVYEHIPGLLRKHGYELGDFSVRHYVDPYDLNMRDGFHFANGRTLASEGLGLPGFFTRGYASTTLFLEETFERVSGRVLHVLGQRTISNPYVAAASPKRAQGEDLDRRRLEALMGFIESARQPFFAHVHLLSTHGGTFPVERRVFSKDKTTEKPWDRDFYDDAVLQYDGFTRELVEFLQARGLYDETLLIINTDHGFRWGINEPLPLIMRFPNGEHAGRVKTNSQRLDIGPTVLDFLGLPTLPWLEGQSLLNSERTMMDPIYIANRMPSVKIGQWRQVKSPKPPFYTLGSINVIYCNALYELNLLNKRYSVKNVENHTAPCTVDALPPRELVRERLVEHLRLAGYDTRSLADPTPPPAIASAVD